MIETCAVGGFVGLVPELAAGMAKTAGLEVAKIKELTEERIDLTLVWNQAVANSKDEVARLIGVLLEGN